MGERGCTRSETMLGIATVLGVIVIVIAAIALGTDHWVNYDVDRTRLLAAQRAASTTGDSARYYHTRHRGIFRTCYPGNETLFLESATGVVDKNCFMVKFFDVPSGASQAYSSRAYLFGFFMILLVVALFVFLLAYMFGIILCLYRDRQKAYIASLLSFIAAFIDALALSLFHGALYLERNSITDNYAFLYYQSWPAELKNVTTRTFGYSYALAWVAVILAGLTALFYALTAYFLTKKVYHKRDYYDKPPRDMYYDQPYAMERYYPPVMYERPMVQYVEAQPRMQPILQPIAYPGHEYGGNYIIKDYDR